MAKTKVKKAVKRAVAKKAAQAAKTRSVKTAPPAKAASKAKAAPKAKKAAKPALAIVEPVPTQPAIESVVVPVVAPKVEKAPVAAPKTVVAASTLTPVACDVLTVKRPPVAVERTKVIQRADLPPTEGFTLLVDGHFKNQYDDIDLVKAAASKLLGQFPKLRVEIYDALKKTRTPI